MDCSYVKNEKIKKDKIKRSLTSANISTMEIARLHNINEEDVLKILNEEM
jgi:hypothetical protein